MQKFDGISFLWAVALLAVIGFLYGLRAFMGYRNVSQDAVEDYDYKQERGMLDGRVSREGHIQVYKRLHNPRSPAYIAMTILAILVLTWPIMAILSFLLELLYQATGRNRVFEPGFLVWQFSIFFAIILSWTGIAYVMARRYHRRAPGTPKYEMDQQALFERTGEREKVVYENDWGKPAYLVIFDFIIKAIFRLVRKDIF